MSTGTAPAVRLATDRNDDFVAGDSLRRFSVDEYHELIRLGVLKPEDRCELLRGYIINQMPRDPIHDAILEIVLALLAERLPPGWRVRPQMAITTPDSEPEPDAAVVKGRPQDNFVKHPTPADTALAVEIAYSSLSRDRLIKRPLYAENGVPVYWIINVVERRVEMYTLPSGPDSEPGYRRREDYTDGMWVPVQIDGSTREPIAVSDLFPPRA